MEEDLEIKVNSKKIIQIIKKYNILLLILIPLFFSIFFRAYPYNLPITDSMASSSIENNLRSQIQSSILSQSQNIDQDSLNILTEQKTQEYFTANKDAITQQEQQLSKQIKQFYKDDSGQTYLLAIDPYQYLRQTTNLVETGHIGDEVVEGKSIDEHMLAPKGVPVSNSFHPLIGAILFKISQIFGNNSIMSTMFFLPLLFAALATIPTFFITKKVAGNLGGLVAAFVVAIHPIFLGRTPAGFSDTDAYTIFFPLLIIWLFLEAFTTPNKKNRYVFGGLAGLSTGIFAFAWEGWWYIFNVILGSLVIYFIYLLIKYKKNIFKKLKTKNSIKTFLSYFISSAIFVILFTSFKEFISFLIDPWSLLVLKQAAKSSLWPNVYTTVAELNTVSLSQVVSSLSGKIFFTLATIGVVLLLLKRKKIQTEVKYSILLILWYAVTLYSTKNGARFIMYVIPIYSIGLGILYGNVFSKLISYGNKELEINKKVVSIVLIILIIISFIPLVKAANDTALHEVPSMNDAWYDSLTKIKQESSEDAIINSWWDFGHWFKAIADRRVTFDGASQNTPPAHWIGKVLLTNNEDEAIAILRMLDCGSNDAYDILFNETNDSVKTKRIIDEIILQDKDSARNTLSQYIDNPSKILEKTHCNPPEDYFITSEDMITKGGVWAHFGSWDFDKSYAYNTVKKNTKEIAIQNIQDNLGYSLDKAESTYRQIKGLTEEQSNQWIAPYPSYSNLGNCGKLNNSDIYCSNNVLIHPNNTAEIRTTQGVIPVKYYRDNTQVYDNSEGNEDIAIAYMPNKSTSVLMDPILLKSMFTELYFYEGQNLNNFELFTHNQGLDGFEIYIWKVKWT